MERLGRGDIPGVVALSAAIGWDYSPEEVETALAAGVMVGCKSAAGTLVACAGLSGYGDRLTSLGMVMVHPEHQGRGLGKVVTQACMDEAGDRPIMLVATDAGKPLYEKLGFQTVSTLHKLIAPQFTPVRAVEPVTGAPPTFQEVLALDSAAFGASRKDFLRARLAQSADQAWLRDAEGRLVGYALGIQSPVVRVIGPVVAPDAASALRLVETLASRHPGRLRIDIPSPHVELIEAVKARGFALDRVPPVMALGDLPARNGTLFAIAAQAYG